MAKFLISIGHGKSSSGGYDPGAVNGNYHEFKIAKEIGKYAYEELKNNYNADCTLMNYDGNLSLEERINKLQDNTYCFICEIHLNAGGGTGPEVYYYPGDKTGENYAKTISSKISTALGRKNRGAKKSEGNYSFGFVRRTKPTANLIETVFIDSADLNIIKSADNQKKCGVAIAEAIASINNLKKQEKPADTNNSGYFIYTVKSGDSPWLISEKFLGNGSRYPELMEYNGLAINATIHPNQVLKIPTSDNTVKTHIVQKGESPWSITEKYFGNGINYPKLLAYNNLEADTVLKPNQVLKIPNKL